MSDLPCLVFDGNAPNNVCSDCQAHDEHHADLDRLRASNKRYREALEWLCPVEDGFTEAFDGLLERGLLVEVPASDAYREEWGADTMYVWEWSRAALSEEPTAMQKYLSEPHYLSELRPEELT